jgi:hypothetical protein
LLIKPQQLLKQTTSQLHDPSRQHHDITTKLADDERDKDNEDEGKGEDETLYEGKDSTYSTATTTPRPSPEALGDGEVASAESVIECVGLSETCPYPLLLDQRPRSSSMD